MKDFQFFRSYMFKTDTWAGSQDLMNQMDVTLSRLTRDLERLRTQYRSGSNTIQDELADRITDYQAQLQMRAENTLNLVGKSDQVYLGEIEHLKKEVGSLLSEKDRLAKQLDKKKNNEEVLSVKLKEMQGKIEVFENVEESKSQWFDGNPDLSGSLDIDRVTKALKKSVELIALLQGKIDSNRR